MPTVSFFSRKENEHLKSSLKVILKAHRSLRRENGTLKEENKSLKKALAVKASQQEVKVEQNYFFSCTCSPAPAPAPAPALAPADKEKYIFFNTSKVWSKTILHEKVREVQQKWICDKTA